MHSNYILDSAANLPVCRMVFVGNVQQSHITSHRKGLDPSFQSSVKVELFQTQRKVDRKRVHISFT